jgi:hypothetical protein
MKRERQTKKKNITKIDTVISLLLFSLGSSILSIRSNGYLPLTNMEKVAIGVTMLGLLWIPIVRLYYSIFKRKK